MRIQRRLTIRSFSHIDENRCKVEITGLCFHQCREETKELQISENVLLVYFVLPFIRNMSFEFGFRYHII